jgi:site-specific DNA recombinase
MRRITGPSQEPDKFDIPIRRDGGIDDLLAEAQRPDRRFDVVICESVDRIARITYYGTKIEHELEQAGVLLLASDEPFTTTRRRATAVLTRRMKQGIAEWYVLDMLEKSWGGFEVHTRQGWNVGRPPYGYVADSVPHPVPARRAEGKHKTRLTIDPQQAATVRAIYDLRIGDRLGYRQIAEHLNTDLANYPPPMPTSPARALGRWTGSSVRDILTNPKYTGHMVWNRRASKKGGRMNRISDWVLSDEPTHPAITPEQFAAAAAVAGYRERSRSGDAPNRHPAARRSYTLRSFVLCASCGRRMFGKTHHGKPIYVCKPPDRRRPTGHPVSIIVPEAPLLTFLSAFFNTHLLGPDRADLLTDALTAHADQDDGATHTRRLAALDQQIEDLAAKQRRILRQAEDAAPGDPFTTGLRERYNDLDIQRRDLEQQRTRLAEHASGPAPGNAADLLARLPIATLDLASLPTDILRALCEAFRITTTFDRESRTVDCAAQIEAGTLGNQIQALASTDVRICVVPPAGLEPALERF